MEPKPKITLRLELGDKYLEKELSPQMISSLFDLQYMIDDWSTIKLNKMTDDIQSFFRIIEHVCHAMHDNKLYTTDKKGNSIECQKRDYMFGKPDWKKKGV